jgi:hypothetical protein
MLVGAVWSYLAEKAHEKIQDDLSCTMGIKFRYLAEKRHLRDKHHAGALSRHMAAE